MYSGLFGVGVCLTIVFCVFIGSVQGGLQSPLCDFKCSNIDAVDEVCENYLCEAAHLSDEAKAVLCSDLCQAAFADVSIDECEGRRRRQDFLHAVDDLDAQLIGTVLQGNSTLIFILSLELCAEDWTVLAPASAIAVDEDDLPEIELDMDD